MLPDHFWWTLGACGQWSTTSWLKTAPMTRGTLNMVILERPHILVQVHRCPYIKTSIASQITLWLTSLFMWPPKLILWLPLALASRGLALIEGQPGVGHAHRIIEIETVWGDNSCLLGDSCMLLFASPALKPRQGECKLNKIANIGQFVEGQRVPLQGYPTLGSGSPKA